MQIISREEAEVFSKPFTGKRITRAWQGSGSAIFLEAGELTDDKGELTIMIEWSWRIENLNKIIFGSFSEPKDIPIQLENLKGLTIKSIFFQSRLPEVVVELSGNTWVCSFSTVEGDPEWALITPGKTLLSSNGSLGFE
jgi:hypothetical protein